MLYHRTGAYSYVADISTERTRTLRIGMIDFMFFLGGTICGALGGYILSSAGAEAVYYTAITFYSTAFIYGLFIMPDSKVGHFKTW